MKHGHLSFTSGAVSFIVAKKGIFVISFGVEVKLLLDVNNTTPKCPYYLITTIQLHNRLSDCNLGAIHISILSPLSLKHLNVKGLEGLKTWSSITLRVKN